MFKLIDGTELTEEIKDAFKKKATKAYIKLKDGTILSDENFLKSLKIEELRYNEETDNFIGEAVAKRATVDLYNKDNSIDLEDKEFEAFIGAELLDGSIAWINFGNFIVQKPENDDTKEATNFEALDYMCKFNVKYEPNVTYPCTYLELVQDICNQCGVELGNTTFRNADKLIYENFFIDGEQCRVVIKEVAKIAFSWARVGNDNKLYIDFENKDIEDAVENFDLDSYIDLTKNNQLIPVDTIILRNSAVESENITIKQDKRPDIKEYKGAMEQDTSQTGKNIVPTDFSAWESGNYDASTGNKNVYTSRIRLKELLEVTPSETYYFATNHSDYHFVVRTYDANKQFVRSVGGVGNKKTVILTADEKYLGTGIYRVAGESGITYETYQELFANGEIKPFICLNSVSDKTFEEFIPNKPSPEYPSEVKTVTGECEVYRCNSNIFKPTLTNNETKIIQSKCTVELNADEYTMIATDKDMFFGDVTQKGVAYTKSKGILYNVKGKTKVYLFLTNKTLSKNLITAYDKNKISLGYSGLISSNGSYTIPEGTEYISLRFGYGSAVAGETYKTKVMLSFDKITEYKPHNSQTFPVSLGKMEIYKDGYIHNKNGKWYKYAKYKKNIPTTYRILTNQPLNDFILIPKLEDDIGYNTYAHPLNMRSNKAIAKNISYSIDTTNTFGGNSSVTNYMFGVKKGITTAEADEFVNGLYIIYELKTPIDEEITDATLIAQLDAIKNELYLSEGINHISFKAANGLDGELKIEYYSDKYRNKTETVTGKNLDLIGYDSHRELVIKEDYFAYNQASRQELIEAGKELYGLTYLPIELSGIGTIYLESNDLITVTDKQGNVKPTYCLNHTIEYNGVLYDDIQSPAMTETETQYQNESAEDLSRRRTEILVNKATQKIELISEKVDTYDTRISSIELGLDSIEAKIDSTFDITRETEGISTITLENTLAGELLELHIYGNNSVFKPLLPSETLYPSDTLYPMGDSLIKITKQTINNNGEIVGEEYEIIDLEQEEELRQKDDVRDEIFLINNELKITRRIGVNTDGTTYVRSIPETTKIKDLIIETTRGNLIIEILNYTASLKAKYVIINEYTNTFATTVEMKAAIELMYNKISLDVSHKVDNNEIFARMNMYIRGLGDQTDIPDDIPRSVIEFFSNSFSWDSDNSSLSPDGILTLRNKTTEPYQYTINDVLAVQNYIKGNTSLTPELIRLYDATGDGVIDISDAVKMLNIINGSEESDKYANATIILNPKNPTEFITMQLEDAIQCKIGLNEIYNYTFRGMNMFLGTYADMENQYGVSINGEKGLITVRSDEASTETRIDAGKVDAYYVLSSSRNKKGRCLHGTDENHDYLCNWNGAKLQFYVDDTNVGELSDERVKSEIGDINEGLLYIVEELEVKQFKLANREGKISVGVIAQELLQLFKKYDLNPEDYDFIYNGQFKLTDETIYFFVNYEQLLVLQNVVLRRKIEKQETKLNYIIEKLGLSEEMEDLFNGTDKLV